MRGYIVLAASVVMQLCLGSVYAWSEFVPALAQNYSLSQTQTQLVFGFNIAIFTISMIFAGRLQDKYGPKPVALIGGALFGIGYFIASASGGSFALIFTGIGVVAGIGVGFGYVCPIATCVKWFPQRKGLVSGLAVAGFGAGAVVLSSIAGKLFASGKDVLDIFRFIALLYGSAIIIASILLAEPKNFTHPTGSQHLETTNIFNNKAFWRLVVGIWAGTFAGLLVIGNLKPIGLASNVSDFYATAAISSFAIGNAAGRITWGVLIDRFGSITIPTSLILLAIAVSALLLSSINGIAFVILAAFIGFGFGACFVVYMAQTANEYGPARVASIYPLIFLAYGLSGIIGPAVGGILFDLTGTYAAAIIAAVIVAIAGAAAQKALK